MARRKLSELPIGMSLVLAAADAGDIVSIHRQSRHSYRWRFLVNAATRRKKVADLTGTATTYALAETAALATWRGGP